MNGPQITRLSGDRLHLHHGPIDLILWAEGRRRAQAYHQAIARFDGLLEELVAELPVLRSPDPAPLRGVIAQSMAVAVTPFRPAFITPMAAVAGAVADAVLAAMCQGTNLTRAYANNGGDIAVHLATGQSLTAAMLGAGSSQLTLKYDHPARGIATSGWGGRSLSRGIADSVTVVARTAAMADAAATMIANAVHLGEHPAITRRPARDVKADSDLGNILVTTAVGTLTRTEITRALNNGYAAAQTYADKGLIAGAALFLHSQSCTLGTLSLVKDPEYV
ncbi:thiamine biosynthesis protein ApbE [Pseudorhodobacter ferrugineus]|uniref:thiamine biosynthesis protein ApbE n=1 Tax=Pseudorhodobacter ferrugineus TaxID=77008 RepID=UPI0003B75D33|nr:thiamine biosynthesis protein ApbE [Pseudorhodobacter ferrugineus]